MTAAEFNYQLTSMQDKLRSFAYSLTTDSEEAQDLLQETLLKALTYREKFVDPTNLKSWVYTIMKNTFINNYRRMTKARTFMDNTKELYFLNIPQDSGFDSPDSSYTFQELTKGIEKLDDEYKIPFKMHVEGYKYKEIAEHLNLPIGSVKSRIFFARKKLMASLKDFHPNKV
jgi:RNA polymerase sigma-70 factor, ECF subfamily